MITAPSSYCGLLHDELEGVVDRTRMLWEDLRGEHIFLTGGTGFFGKWLIATFCFANELLELDAQMTLLSRDPARFLREQPELGDYSAIQFVQGDVRNFDFPRTLSPIVVHAATDASASLNANSPELMLDVIIEGTKRVIDFCSATNAHKLLLVSSGAVYGPQPANVANLPEDYQGAPNLASTTSAYSEGKRVAELLGAMAHARTGLEVSIARCFAFVGPHLPLDRHFAIGNFLHDALSGNPITVQGTGTAVRSYMYAADLAAWLWTILMRGQSCRPYNVGSEAAVSIANVASEVATHAGVSCIVQGRTAADTIGRSLYVPSTKRAQAELGLSEKFTRLEAINRTFEWYSQSRTHSMRQG